MLEGNSTGNETSHNEILDEVMDIIPEIKEHVQTKPLVISSKS